MSKTINTAQCILAPILVLVGILITIGFCGDPEGPTANNVVTWVLAGVCPFISGVLTLINPLLIKNERR